MAQLFKEQFFVIIKNHNGRDRYNAHVQVYNVLVIRV